MNEITVENWEEAKIEFNKLVNSGMWIFRGQSDSSCPLMTSLERWIADNNKLSTDVVNNEESIEKIFLDVFRNGAHHYLKSSLHLPQDTLEWLGLMQHHGTPTRLLDFTKSPYIASFFAFEYPGEPTESCAVWAINEMWCRTSAISIINKAHEDDENFEKLHEYIQLSEKKYFEKIFLRDPKMPQMVFPVCSKRKSERLTVQQGLFLCPGGANESFEEQLENLEDSYNNVKKIILHNKLRKEVIVNLRLMNITSASLFPGLDGFAKSVKNFIYTKKVT